MNSENIPNPEKERSKAWILYGGPGHSMEYTLNLEGYDSMDEAIPHGIVERLQNRLGDDWEVQNRGTRIEILGEEDPVVLDAVREVLGEEYELIIE